MGFDANLMAIFTFALGGRAEKQGLAKDVEGIIVSTWSPKYELSMYGISKKTCD